MTDTPSPGTGPTVNGAPYDAPPGTTVSDLVAAWCPSPRGVAVAIDSEVVPKSTWSARVVGPGDRVEIVHGVAGG
ncbi:MAG: sulfur carrier protein ThiS [Acidimicrobiales bacterium]